MSLSKGRLAREWLLGKAMSVLRPRVFLKRMPHRLIATFWLFRLVCDVLDTTANYAMKDVFCLDLQHDFTSCISTSLRFVWTWTIRSM